MSHWLILPVLLPALTAAGAFALGARPRLQRALNLASCVALALVAAHLMSMAADGEVRTYALGNWRAPFGIVLVLDRLAALMVLLTAGLALAVLVYALSAPIEERHSRFHALFQFQLMGLNGAFLTGDLFNLFVFFEVLLIASYGLLLCFGGAQRLRAGLHYVVLNLTGSALFLLGVGLVYGVTGTLNLADLSIAVGRLEAQDAALAQAAGLLLLVVFALKAALFPLCFWLPQTYAAAAAPAAALFAIMTKVGVYAILRVHSLVFGAAAGAAAADLTLWVLPAGVATQALGMCGALASGSLRKLTAHLTLVSVGTCLVAVGLATPLGRGAAVYYALHSTLATATLFLVADLIARQRGEWGDRLRHDGAVAQPALLGLLFLLAASAAAGMPPLSGFVGKVLVMQAAAGSGAAAWVWTALLATGLLTVVGTARAGILLFWESRKPARPGAPGAAPAAVSAAFALIAAMALLAAFAGPVSALTQAIGADLSAPQRYIAAVLGR